jgi:hypothetical protein
VKASRRQTLAGALALPALGALPQAGLGRAGGTIFVHDPSLQAGRRLAAAHGSGVLAIEGDRIRFTRKVLEGCPALIVGVSRPADAMLIEDVAREAGYWTIDAQRLHAQLADGQSLDRGRVVGWMLARHA